MELKDTIVLITGGGSGLGAAAAYYLAKKGARIAILDTSKEAIDRVVSDLKCIGILCDISNEEDIKKALDQVNQTLGIPRVCINCAGILDGGRIVGREGPMKADLFRKVIGINLIGTFMVMELALANMMKLQPVPETEERGVVINVASVAAYEGQLGQVAYSASKGGIMGMTLPAAREMGEYGIRVVSIAPGVFETPMMQKASDKVRSGLLESAIFPKRFGLPEEFAKLIAHIIDNPMMNGDTIPLDGAMRMPPR